MKRSARRADFPASGRCGVPAAPDEKIRATGRTSRRFPSLSDDERIHPLAPAVFSHPCISERRTARPRLPDARQDARTRWGAPFAFAEQSHALTRRIRTGKRTSCVIRGRATRSLRFRRSGLIRSCERGRRSRRMRGIRTRHSPLPADNPESSSSAGRRIRRRPLGRKRTWQRPGIVFFFRPAVRGRFHS